MTRGGKADYKDGSYQGLTFSYYFESCIYCGSRDEVVAHHINGEREDDTIENLVPLCRSCHQKVHGYKNELPPLLNFFRNQLHPDDLMYGNNNMANRNKPHTLVQMPNELMTEFRRYMRENDYDSQAKAIEAVFQEAGYEVRHD